MNKVNTKRIRLVMSFKKKNISKIQNKNKRQYVYICRKQLNFIFLMRNDMLQFTAI